jgi:hypothetical protein
MGVSSGRRRWSPLRLASLNFYAFWCLRRVKTMEVITKRWPVVCGILPVPAVAGGLTHCPPPIIQPLPPSTILCTAISICSQATRKYADERRRKAYGVRPACWRFRSVCGRSKAGAGPSHSIRFAQFGCGLAALDLGLSAANCPLRAIAIATNLTSAAAAEAGVKPPPQ